MLATAVEALDFQQIYCEALFRGHIETDEELGWWFERLMMFEEPLPPGPRQRVFGRGGVVKRNEDGFHEWVGRRPEMDE